MPTNQSLFADKQQQQSVSDELFAAKEERKKVEKAAVSDDNVDREAMMQSFLEVPLSENQPSYMADLIELRDQKAAVMTKQTLFATRQKLAYEEKSNQLKNITAAIQDYDVEEELKPFIRDMARAEMAEPIETTQEYVVEKMVTDKMRALSANNSEVARLMRSVEEYPEFMDYQQDRLIKDLMVQRYIDNISQDARERHILNTGFDFLVDVLFFTDAGTSRTGNIEISQNDFFNWILPAKQVERQAHALDKMSYKELAAALPKIDAKLRENSSFFFDILENKGEKERLFKELVDTPNPAMTNTFAVVEPLSFVPVTKTASLTAALMTTGGRRQAARATAAALRSAKDTTLETASKMVGMTKDEVIDNTLPSALKPSAVLEKRNSFVSLATEADEAYAQGRDLFEQLVTLNSSKRLSPDEFRQAVTAVSKKMDEATGNYPIRDVSIRTETLSSGSEVSFYEVILGSQKGVGGWAKKDSATRALKTNGLAGEAFQDPSGQWFARAEMPIAEGEAFIAPLNVKSKTIAHRGLLSSSNIGDRNLDGMAQQAGAARSKISKTFTDIWNSTGGKLSKKQHSQMEPLLVKSTDENKWYSRGEIQDFYETTYKRSPSELELETYETYRIFGEMEYALRNDEAYKQAIIRGEENVKFLRTPNGLEVDMNGVVKRKISNVPNTRAYNISDEVHYTSKSPMSPKELKRLQEEGYIEVKLGTPQKLSDGTVTDTFIAKASDVQVGNLHRIQIPYKAGPHREYADQWFVKQATVFKQADTGSQYLSIPRTFRNTFSKKQAAEWADTMNQARLAYLNDKKDLVTIANIFDGRANYPSADEFVKAIKKGQIDPKERFEAVFNRELPSRYREPTFGTKKFIVESEDRPIESMAQTHGRMYYSKRGDRLKGFDGNEAPVLEPRQVLQRSVDNMIRAGAFSDYQNYAVSAWKKTFDDVIDPDSVSANASARTVIENARYSPKAPKDVRHDLFEGQREIIKRILNMETPGDVAGRRMNRYVQDALSDMPGAQKAIRNNWETLSNPLNALRSFAFHVKLGLFNIGQLMLQASTGLQASMLSNNMNMFSAFFGGTITRFAAGHTLDNVALSVLDRPGVVKALGLKTKDNAANMLKALRNSGWLEVDSSHTLINAQSNLAGRAGLGKMVPEALHNTGFFFYQAEKFNRGVAFHIAWREAAEKYGFDMARPNNGEFMAFVMRKANDYSFQMTKESAAAWQHGLASIPTQFFSYPARVVELMTGDTLTRSQRLRLVFGQTAMFGSAGLPFTGAVSDYLKSRSGGSPEPGSFTYLLDRGLFDAVVWSMFRTDVQISGRIGTGDFWVDTAREIMDSSKYGDVGPLDVMLGAGFSIASDTAGATVDAIRYAVAERGQFNATYGAFLRVAKQISTVGNSAKAYYAMRHGTYVSNSGTVLSHDMDKMDALFLAFGIQPGFLDDFSSKMSYLKNEKERVDEIAKLRSNLLQRYVTEPDNREEILDDISALRALTDDNTWYKAVKASSRYTPTEMYESIGQQVAKDQQQKALFREQHENRTED